MKTRIIGILLTLTMIIGLLPITASAAEQDYCVDIASGDITLTETDGVKYANGTAYEGELTVTDSDTTIANVLTIESGEHNVTIDSVTANQIDVSAGAKLNLTLTGASTVTPSGDDLAAIHIPEGAELVITEDSTGSVIATGGSDGAGIGGARSESNGKITICGGTVDAIGFDNGAGIGGGFVGAGKDITITGGTVTAKGGYNAAGIGGGFGGAGNNITIAGGTVTATSGYMAAGIGGGAGGAGKNITISGGIVTVSCFSGESCIGSGYNAASAENIYVSPLEGCTISVRGNKSDRDLLGKYTQATDITSFVNSKTSLYFYTCTAYHVDNNKNSECDVCMTVVINISLRDITFTETDGVKYVNGIAYEGAFTVLDSDTTIANVLTIESGEHNVTISSVTAEQIDVKSGAKLNLTLAGESTIKPNTSKLAAIHVPEGAELVITEGSQGSVNATGADYVAGIGGGEFENSGKITICGGTVNATGGRTAAGIGGGYYGNGTNITISGGTVEAKSVESGAGIGGGIGRAGKNIIISGGVVTATGGSSGAGIGGGYNGYGTNITISGGVVTATGGSSGAGIGGGFDGDGTNITISGDVVTATGGSSGAGIGGGFMGEAKNIFVSPDEYCAITIKKTETSTDIIGKYTEKTDVTSKVSAVQIYIYTTTCGGIHIDEDSDNTCDVCGLCADEVHNDEDGDHKCDVCSSYIDELHNDEDDDHLCDVCNQITSECVDTNPADHNCDICKAAISVCIDANNDYSCDICKKMFIDIAAGDITLTEADGVKYVNGTAYGDTIEITDSDTTEANVLLIESGEHNVTISSVTAKQISVAAGAKLNLTLAGESTINPYTTGLAAIHVPEGAELVITENSTGSVNATGADYSAGIGGAGTENSGKITICGGTVDAIGYDGAGIGGGYYGNGENITISGGTVTAVCTTSGAGIGGGPFGNGINITISGGTVEAKCVENGAGIGGGNNGYGENIFVSPQKNCAITVKDNETSTSIIGKYTEKTDVTYEVENFSIYLYTTTCGGNHFDEDSDHKCDICEAYIDSLHSDEDNNHLCDICDYVMTECDFDTNNGFCSVCGEIDAPELKDNYYQIENAGNLYWFANYINTVDRTANAVLLADIDLEGKSDGTGRKWTPIGSTGENSNNFRGHFDGRNHTITNLYIDMQRAGIGLFGEVRLGIVENFTIYGDVKLYGDCSYVGGVIGSAPGANGTDVPDHNGATIRNITSYVDVTLVENAHGSSFVGGFIGYANHETIIENCSWYGTLDLGAYRADSGVGGLVGRLYDKSNVTIRNCGAYGTIKTSYKSGTYQNYDTIYIGGVLSFSPAKTLAVLENNLWAGNFINDTDLGNKAHLSAFGTLNGEEVVTNCYTIDSVPYLTTENANATYITTVTAQRLANGEVAYLLQGEQTTDVWGQDLTKENSLPVLGGDKVYLRNGIYYNEVKVFEILSNGTNGTKATATLSIPTAGTYTLIFADYEGATLNKMDLVTVTTESDNSVVAVPSEIDITLGKVDKILLWQDMTSLVPLCDEYILK